MIQLSYSTINMLYRASHNWLNKQMGLQPEEREEWKEGKAAHRIIQDHVSGKKLDERLKHINFSFPIVEEKEFDERCKFEFPIKVGKKDNSVNEYKVIGFFDGLDIQNKRFLEIKASDPLWSLIRFQDSMQRKLYAFAKGELTEAILITCSKNIERWSVEPPKVYRVPLTPQDKSEAVKWLLGGIEIIENGSFKGGLDEDGVCRDKYCYYGNNCQFK